jgi:ubiquinone biosynthesis protein
VGGTERAFQNPVGAFQNSVEARIAEMSVIPLLLVARRGLSVFASFGAEGASFVAGLPFRRGESWRARYWRHFALACERSGGAFSKLAQFLSSRPDLVGPEAIDSLSRLLDHARPIAFAAVDKVLRSALGDAIERYGLSVDPKPLATATIAQIHLATTRVDPGQTLALKIKRPGIEQILRMDIALIRFGVSAFARLPALRGVPLREALDELCRNVWRQIDFAHEADCFRLFKQAFEGTAGIGVPQIHAELSTSDVIAMEYMAGYEPLRKCSRAAQRQAAVTGLRALYKMLFELRVFHCDLHPGNILSNDAGDVALLDMGLVADIAPPTQLLFAQFFASIAFCNAKQAARVVLETATAGAQTCEYSALLADLQSLLDRVGGMLVATFSVAGFVTELFQIQQRHGLHGAPDFTMAIMSLLTYEGTLKSIVPDVAFQREALPFVVQALATGMSRRVHGALKHY